MPRKPLGTYRRTTGDWFQHQRAIATGYTFLQSGNGCAIGLKNSDQSGRVCHLLGVTIAVFTSAGTGGPVAASAEYYGAAGTPLAPPDDVENSQTEPFFDLDPVPNVNIEVFYPLGSFPEFNRAVPLVIGNIPPTPMPDQNGNEIGAIFYPDGGIAAFKPGRGFAYYAFFPPGPPSQTNFGVSFDFVMLPD